MASAPRIRPALRVWRIRGLDQWDLVADGDIKQGIMASMLTEHNTTFSSTLVARVHTVVLSTLSHLAPRLGRMKTGGTRLATRHCTYMTQHSPNRLSFNFLVSWTDVSWTADRDLSSRHSTNTSKHFSKAYPSDVIVYMLLYSITM